MIKNKLISSFSIFIFLVIISSCAGMRPLQGQSEKEYTRPKISLSELTKVETRKNSSEKELDLYSFEIEEIAEVQEVAKSESAPKRASKKAVGQNSQSLKLNYSKKHYNFWIKFFSKRDRSRFQRHLLNGAKYQKVVRQIFREHGLPEDLYYVGLIESGYNSRIHSRAGAAGPWQFMKGTARRYGLIVNSQIDERYNLVKATHGAAQYFKDLYNIFGSWELALCAYNKGEYGIIRAIRKGNTRDYRELVAKKLIPKETSYYIPKIAAARRLEKNSRKNGFRRGKASKILSTSGLVKVKKSFSQKSLAAKVGITLKEFKHLNPDLKHRMIKVRRKGLSILLPHSKHGLVARYRPSRKVAAQLSKQKTQSRKSTKSYRVRKGDNLIRIARKFKTTVRNIKSANNLRSDKIRYGQKLKIIGGRYYVVRHGDNLNVIARKFNTSVRALLAQNNLKNSRIYPRQHLLIPL